MPMIRFRKSPPPRVTPSSPSSPLSPLPPGQQPLPQRKGRRGDRGGQGSSSASSSSTASVELCIQNPMAWLWVAVRESIVLREHVKRLARADVVDIVIYNDGVTPGNVLGHITRKFEAIYWSLLGLPPDLLAQDRRQGWPSPAGRKCFV